MKDRADFLLLFVGQPFTLCYNIKKQRCGQKLPESRRTDFVNEPKKPGFKNPFNDENIADEYNSSLRRTGEMNEND